MVQRETGLLFMMSVPVFCIRLIVLNFSMPYISHQKFYSVSMTYLYDSWFACRFQEIDYTKEAANAELFAKNFKDLDYVKVPNIYWEYTTPQVRVHFN